MITLGVIGVVAALTMPSLVAHYRGKVIKTQLKKSLSVVNQAVRAGMAKEDITESSYIADCFRSGNNNSSFNSPSLCSFLVENASVAMPKSYDYANMISSYMTYYGGFGSKAYNELSQNVLNSSIPDVKFIGAYVGCGIVPFQLSDGAIIGLMALSNPSRGDCTLKGQELTDAFVRANYYYCGGLIDVNGIKGPNKFALCNDGSVNLTPSEPCEVGEGNIGDIYPIIFHDGIFEMATNAGAYVYNN